MQLTKLHGLGNDFLVAFVDQPPADAAGAARRWCARRQGIGADGLIFAVEGGDGSVTMALHNSDGSVAELSGNGLRCLGHAVARRRNLSTLDLTVHTVAGDRDVAVRPGADADVVSASVDLGPPGTGPQISCDALEAAGVAVARTGSCDVGNPHVVLEVEDPWRVDLAKAGPAVEAHFLPTGVNVHFVSVAEDRSGLDLAVWERGAGITAACGTGAAAAVVVANQWGAVDDTVTVAMPGGEAVVELGESTVLRGPSTFIATIEVPHG